MWDAIFVIKDPYDDFVLITDDPAAKEGVNRVPTPNTPHRRNYEIRTSTDNTPATDAVTIPIVAATIATPPNTPHTKFDTVRPLGRKIRWPQAAISTICPDAVTEFDTDRPAGAHTNH